jgi:hypothetical protein
LFWRPIPWGPRPPPPATGQQPKPDQFGKVRRNIARLKTVLREKHGASAGGTKK